MNKHLIAYIADRNHLEKFYNSICAKPAPESELNLLDAANLSPAQVKELLYNLESALSPENLCCDGELRGAKLRAKAAMLNGAKAALEAM